LWWTKCTGTGFSSSTSVFSHNTLHQPYTCLYLHVALTRRTNRRSFGKGKGKVHPRTGHENQEGEQIHSSTLPSTSGPDGEGDQSQAPVVLSPGKTQYPLYRRLGGFQGRSGRVRKISPPPGFDPRTVHPVASRYTGCVIPGPYEAWEPSEKQ
jgi:hypothetical protein